MPGRNCPAEATLLGKADPLDSIRRQNRTFYTIDAKFLRHQPLNARVAQVATASTELPGDHSTAPNWRKILAGHRPLFGFIDMHDNFASKSRSLMPLEEGRKEMNNENAASVTWMVRCTALALCVGLVSESAAEWTVSSLHPAGQSSSEARGGWGFDQVGNIYNGAERATFWSGTASSWVNLDPAGSSESMALVLRRRIKWAGPTWQADDVLVSGPALRPRGWICTHPVHSNRKPLVPGKGIKWDGCLMVWGVPACGLAPPNRGWISIRSGLLSRSVGHLGWKPGRASRCERNLSRGPLVRHRRVVCGPASGRSCSIGSHGDG